MSPTKNSHAFLAAAIPVSSAALDADISKSVFTTRGVANFPRTRVGIISRQ